LQWCTYVRLPHSQILFCFSLHFFSASLLSFMVKCINLQNGDEKELWTLSKSNTLDGFYFSTSDWQLASISFFTVNNWSYFKRYRNIYDHTVGVVGSFFNVLSFNSWPLLHPHTQTHKKKKKKDKQNKINLINIYWNI
jgi:hypothetical protein